MAANPKPQLVGGRDCALYIRVSTVDQGDRFSPASQEKRLREKAKRDGWNVRWVFSDKFSGKLSDRPEFNKLKVLVKTGVVGAVLIYDVSRFARKTMDALWLAADFKRNGTKLDFYEAPYEDSAAGRLSFTQMAAVAEFLGEKIVEDSKRGVREKLEQGILPHANAPYGLLAVDGHFVSDDSLSGLEGVSKAEALVMIYKMRDGGMQTGKLVREINRLGILSQGCQGGRGGSKPPGLWSRGPLLRVLTNPTYKGEHTCAGVMLRFKPLIDPDLWERVQRINSESRHEGRPTKRNLLTGFLYCPLCQHRWGSQRSNGFTSYFCRRTNRKRQKLCKAHSVRAKVLEPAVWKAIWRHLTDAALLLANAKAYYDSTARPDVSQRALQREASKLKGEIERIGYLMVKGLRDMDKGELEIRTAQKRLTEIESELRAAGRVITLPTEHQLRAALREIADPQNEPLEFDERRPVLEAIQNLRVEYRGDSSRRNAGGEAVITGFVPVAVQNCKRTLQCIDSFTVPLFLKVRVA